MPPIMPSDLTQDQKEQFLIGYRLRCLDVGLQRYAMQTKSWSGSDDPVLLFHKDMKQKILATKGTPLLMNQAANWKASPPGTKRKLSDDDQATSPNKRVNLSEPASGSAQASQTSTTNQAADSKVSPPGTKRKLSDDDQATSPNKRVNLSEPASGSGPGSQTSTTFANIAKDNSSKNKSTVATSLDSRESTPSLEGNDVLFEVKAKAAEYDDKKSLWDTKGVGLLQVVQHQQTKKTRLVLRTPGGRIVMNMALLSWVQYNLVESKNSVTFVNPIKDGKLQTMKLKVKEDADARKLASLMENNKSN